MLHCHQEQGRIAFTSRESKLIGKRLHAKRMELGISLRELANRTNLTASFISQIERDLTSPSITSLRRIASALDVPIFYFLMDDGMPNPVVKRDRRRKLILPNSHLTYELLSPDLNRKMEVFMARLEPGAVSCDVPLGHPSEECIFVLQGKMEIQIGEDKYIVEQGDSIYYDGSAPHKITSIGDEALVFISSTTPPVF